MPVGGAMQIVDDDMKQASQEHPELQVVYQVIKESKLTVQVRNFLLFFYNLIYTNVTSNLPFA